MDYPLNTEQYSLIYKVSFLSLASIKNKNSF